ncbi:MAG: SDR family NAD(P)-dependent oxidoreductase [Elusimicrobia bacterium]|nr:SDR family NAD(P)-dependent oxidoreductase [Elusimicrobiota bacterium]
MKRILITGATSGLGRELALRLAGAGTRLALTGRRESLLRRTAAEVQARGAEVLVLPGAVEDAAVVGAHYAALRERFGGLDWAVLNAGMSISADARERFSAQDFRRVFDVNVFGLANWIEAVLPDMLRARSGVIAGVASVAGWRGIPRSGPYSASKAAAITLLESLRVDLRGTGVDVVTICPGFVRTEMTSRWRPEDMPFLMEPGPAAAAMIRGIEARRSLVHFPWPFSTALRHVVRHLPDFVYDRIAGPASRRRPKQ